MTPEGLQALITAAESLNVEFKGEERGALLRQGVRKGSFYEAGGKAGNER